MTYANVNFGNECREQLIAGVNLCSDAVQTTFGPNGRSSIILTPAGVKITKDGYNTALEVNDSNPYITMGIKMVQDTCGLTAKSVGDGSSSTAILIRDLVNAFSGNHNPVQLTREIKKYSESVISKLNEKKFVVSSKEDLIKVASISANNDSSIGNIVADAFDKVGKDGVVTISESEDVVDHIEYSEGFVIDRGYSSQYFVNTPKGTCELENVYVYISETKMDEVMDVARLAEECIKDKNNKKSLLIIAPNFDSSVTIGLKNNLDILDSCTVITPGHHAMRDEWIKDLKILLGESSMCKKVIITKNSTTFIGCDSHQSELEERIKYLRDKIEVGQLSEYDLNIYKKRLANFTSGIATIYVGGYSQVEMKERYDRIEDAVCATQAALTDGILPGGGVVLRDIADNFLNMIPEEESEVIESGMPEFGMGFELDYGENAAEFYEILKNFSKYLKTEDKTPEDMINEGVIEPFLVEKTVIENAISTASLILTADVAIVNMNTYLN